MGGVVINMLTLAGVVFAAWQVTRWAIDRAPAFDDELVIDVDVPPWADPECACPECEGIGALVGPGLLRPCPQCEGTGVS